jgi:bacterioferritin
MVVSVLNEFLATELVCWLRYHQHALVASGIASAQVRNEFLEHADEELHHALAMAERITQLGGTPNFDPACISARSSTVYREYGSSDLAGMLKENLIAERIVIQTYQEVVQWLAGDDPTTRRLMEKVLADEEEHASDLRGLLGDLIGAD